MPLSKNFKLYDDAPLGVCILSPKDNLKVLYANKAFKTMFRKRKDVQVFEEFYDGNESFLKRLAGPTPPKTQTILLEGGKKKNWVKLHIEPVRIERKKALVLWADDITDTKLREEKLQREVEKADAAAEMKANFLATMSHEIRTPMQAVYGFLELIGQEDPPEAIESMVNTAKQSASGLLDILDDILDFAKMDADKMELDDFDVPVRTLIHGIIEALGVRIRNKDIELKADIAQDVPFVVAGDPKRLRQILMNLVGNAIKFTEKGSVTVRVTNHKGRKKSEERRLRFEVIDTGIGMPQAVADTLFQPFTQADSSTARKFGGTGLGLSICKKLVELMGGKIAVKSEEGEGSNFYFDIPTRDVTDEDKEVELPDLSGLSVLSVEDHPKGAKEIYNSLKSMGASVESCASGVEALELINKRPFDVAIIDQGLPDMLGLDLIKLLVDIQPNTGLIMYTMRDDAGLQYSLKSLGATYLSKPASRLGLGEAVSGAAKQQHAFDPDRPKRLLIAEDTESVRDVIGRQLKNLGVEADFAVNGMEALRMLEKDTYGIVISDLHMPELDGYGLVKALRDEEEKTNAVPIPVIVLTADVQMAQRQVYMSHGFDECLLKPVTLGQLRGLLIRWGMLEAEAASDSKAPAQEKAGGGEAKTLDLELLEQQMGALGDGTRDMMLAFIDMTAPIIEELKTAEALKDKHRLAEAAHSLKGAAHSAACTRLGNLAAEIQTCAEKDKPANTNAKDIEQEFEEVKAAIKAL